ncbi:alcohol dehydrogenase catalytic domain-containing protein [Streptomyces sp. NBC_01239]|uniref:alcohol dehydrogenase catalytic domain-containing protein n=1 Tax=Streptomyces sp. NBC_01239 TaxID=2903792 RepID=UPI0022547925|nr:alcohol dehydrogenase catalytic domain-containing protein [Streptomyces sp. NBC_01239]MCX4815175.1 alcohol dehydrogenase catalytic domain-containing protein [Streptomyces sp. NBC_01239]
MKALRWHGARDLRLEEVPDPPGPQPHEAVVEVSWCGVCGTDLHEFLEGPHMIRSGPHPLTGAEPPLALGHEFSGTVLALGGDIPGIAVGDRVTADPVWRCGVCYWCTRGEYHICPKSGSVGLASSGAFAERVTVPLAGLTRLPDNVSDEMAALAEPLAVGLHAVTRAGVRAGDNVLVLGGGPIGFAVVLAARLAGAAGLYVSEPLKERRERLLEVGVTEAFDPRETDVRRELFVRTGRIGPDVVIDATGVPALAAQAVATVRRGGRVVLAGVGHGSVEIEMGQLVFYERTLLGTLGYNFDIPRVIDLMSTGRLDASPLLTGRFSLTDGAGVFEDLAADRARHLKVLLTPKGL